MDIEKKKEEKKESSIPSLSSSIRLISYHKLDPNNLILYSIILFLGL